MVFLGANGAGKIYYSEFTYRFSGEADSGIIKITNSNDQLITKRHDEVISLKNVNLYPYLSGIENLDYFCRLIWFNF